jgi:hypothetical protein
VNESEIPTRELAYTVVLVIESPTWLRPKQYVPALEGVTWRYFRHGFRSNDWMEYAVAAQLNQAQMDALMEDHTFEYDGHSGGICSPVGFPHVIPPALVYRAGECPEYELVVSPFPAGLRCPEAYRWGKWRRHQAMTRARYRFDLNAWCYAYQVAA